MSSKLLIIRQLLASSNAYSAHPASIPSGRGEDPEMPRFKAQGGVFLLLAGGFRGENMKPLLHDHLIIREPPMKSRISSSALASKLFARASGDLCSLFIGRYFSISASVRGWLRWT